MNIVRNQNNPGVSKRLSCTKQVPSIAPRARNIRLSTSIQTLEPQSTKMIMIQPCFTTYLEHGKDSSAREVRLAGKTPANTDPSTRISQENTEIGNAMGSNLLRLGRNGPVRGNQAITEACLNAALELRFWEAQACWSHAIRHIQLHLVEILRGNGFSVSQEVPPIFISSSSPCFALLLYVRVACSSAWLHLD